MTTRAALTTISIIIEEGLGERAAELGGYAMERLRTFGERCPAVGDVRGRGLLFGVEIVSDQTDFAPDNALAERAYYRCLEAGLSLKISQGNVMTLSPPMVISREDLDRALTIVEQSILAG